MLHHRIDPIQSKMSSLIWNLSQITWHKFKSYKLVSPKSPYWHSSCFSIVWSLLFQYSKPQLHLMMVVPDHLGMTLMEHHQISRTSKNWSLFFIYVISVASWQGSSVLCCPQSGKNDTSPTIFTISGWCRREKVEVLNCALVLKDSVDKNIHCFCTHFIG